MIIYIIKACKVYIVLARIYLWTTENQAIHKKIGGLCVEILQSKNMVLSFQVSFVWGELDLNTVESSLFLELNVHGFPGSH